MKKSICLSATLLLFGAVLLRMQGREAVAQPTGVYILAIDLDIVPGEITKVLELVKLNGAATAKESRCREFNIHVLANNSNHVFLYEVFDNKAALDAHRGMDHFKQFQAATASMIAKREIRPMLATAFNSKGH